MNESTANVSTGSRQLLPRAEPRVSITPEQIRSFLLPDNPGPYLMLAARETEFSKVWTVHVHHHLGGRPWELVIRLHKGTLVEARTAIESGLTSAGFELVTPLQHVGNELQCLTEKKGWKYLA